MPARKNTAPEAEVSDYLKVQTGIVHCFVVGTSPIILNRMSEKAKHQLLHPSPKKNATEKLTTLKHDPIAEFQASAYRLKDPKAPTLLAVLSTAFKGSLRTAALDMPGAKKSQIGRLTYIAGEHVSIYGLPKLFMSVTRSADMNRTPDIRTRAIIPEWAAKVSVTYVMPLIKQQAVVNLLVAAGITVGVGDWRPEKGAGSYGQFEVRSPEDKEFQRIIKAGGREAQEDAMDNPVCYDDESTEMLSWYTEEVSKRKLRGVA